MSIYINELNKLFSEKSFSEWHIDDVCWHIPSVNDNVRNVFQKYSKAFNCKEFKIDVLETDGEIIKNISNQSDNILIRAYENYLLASCKTFYKKSKLVDITKEFIEMFFQNIENIDGGLPSHNLLILLRWTTFKFPQEKNAISTLLYDKLINDELNKIRCLSVIGRIIHEIQTEWFFTGEQYMKLYEKYISIEKVDKREVYIFYDEIKEFLKLPLSNDIIKRLKQDLCRYTFLNIDSFDDYHKQIELQKIRKLMDELKSFSDEDYAIIDKNLETANKNVLSSMQIHDIPLDKELQKNFGLQVERQGKEYSQLSNKDKILKLLVATLPLSINQLQQSIDSRKDDLVSICGERVLDEDGRVINFEKLSDQDEFSFKSAQDISIHVDVYTSLIFTPFYKTFTIDDNVKKYISDILTNNKLVSSDKFEILLELFISFFNKDFKNSVYNIIEEFESSLRFFLKNEGLNIKKKDGSGDVIGLNNIFNNFKTNSFKEKLLEYIDEDFYFTLKWFLTDKFGFDLRDKIAHRLSSKELHSTNYAIFSVIQIFRLYWGLKIIEFN